MMEAANKKEEVLRVLGVPEESVEGIYVFGSRAFGTATPTSGLYSHISAMRQLIFPNTQTGIFMQL
mgnify:CR=1 FL=1